MEANGNNGISKKKMPVANNNKNGVSHKREQTAQRIIEAISKSEGLLTLAAKNSGISYTTVNKYVHDFPSVAQAVYEAKERMIDFAESKLYEKIKAGDNTAIIFYLKTQGKSRGYIERQEFSGEGGKPMEVKIDYRSKILNAISRYDARESEGKSDKES